jgi:hypothetical protein
VNEALEALVRSQQLERVKIGEPEAMRDLSAAFKLNRERRAASSM